MSKGCSRHIEGIHIQIGRKPSVYDFLSLVLPVRGIQNGHRVFHCIHDCPRSKSRDDLIRAQLAKFVIVVSGHIIPPCNSTYLQRFPRHALTAG